MPSNLKRLAALGSFDLSVVREELQSAAEPLTEILGMPVEFLGADANEAAYITPEGFVTAKYSMNENDIEFDEFEYSESLEADNRDETIDKFLEAISNDDTEAADEIFNSLTENAVSMNNAKARLASLVEPTRQRIEERLRMIPEAAGSGITVKSPIFARENYPCLAKLDEVAVEVDELMSEGIESDGDDLNEAFRFKSRGGKVKKVKINRKAKRMAKKTARKNRAQLVRNLKKARRALNKISKRPSFRRRVAKVRRLNASVDYDGVQQTLIEIATSQPKIAYLTVNEMEDIVRKSLVMEGIEKPEPIIVEETAEALIRLSRELLPESKKHIVDAASLVIEGNEEVGVGDDIDDAIECSAFRLYEAMDKEDAAKLKVAKSVKDIVDDLVNEMNEDADDSDTTEEGEELRSILKTLRGYQETLSSFVDTPENIDVNRIGAIINNISEMFDVEVEEEKGSDEGEEPSEDAGSEEGKEAASDDANESVNENTDSATEGTTDAAIQAFKNIVEALQKRGGDVNESVTDGWTFNGKAYHFVIDESVNDGGIFGEVEGPDGPEGTFRIDEAGNVKRFPTATSAMIKGASVANSGKFKKAKDAEGLAKESFAAQLEAEGFVGLADTIEESLETFGMAYNQTEGTLVIKHNDGEGYAIVDDITLEFVREEVSAQDERFFESAEESKESYPESITDENVMEAIMSLVNFSDTFNADRNSVSFSEEDVIAEAKKRKKKKEAPVEEQPPVEGEEAPAAEVTPEEEKIAAEDTQIVVPSGTDSLPVAQKIATATRKTVAVSKKKGTITVTDKPEQSAKERD